MTPRIGFVTSGGGGGGRILGHWPAQALRRAGWDVTWCRAEYPPPEACDLVIIHRPMAPDTHRRVRDYRAAGLVVLVHEDDYLEGIPERFHVQASQKELREHRQSIRDASGLLVTTQFIKDHYGPWTSWSAVVPNYLPGWIAGRTFINSDGRVRVGWAGVALCHYVDLMWLAPASERAFYGAVFTNVGDGSIGRWMPLGPHAEMFDYEPEAGPFYSLMARADIGIVPLDPSYGLNKGKSWLKALEYQLLGKPVVGMRDLPEQAALIEDGVTGFLASTPDEFADAVQALVQDRGMRERMSEAAREHAQDYTLERNINRWEDALTEAWERLRPRSRRRQLMQV